MKVEIWSDVTCVFCYMSKRKFESAISVFKNASDIEITWRSFQLLPDLKSEPHKSFYQSLSENSGMSLEQSKAACDQVKDAAALVGLIYDFDKAKPVNTFNAHRFSHLAKAKGLQTEAEELLFKSYFTDGRNIDDISTLVELGTTLGLNSQETRTILEGDRYTSEVRDDIRVAQQMGVPGVPYYLFNSKHIVTGDRDTQALLQVLEKAYAEWTEDNLQRQAEVTEGKSCMPGGRCQ
ncbi:MAG: DsbA family oxidoreductase [Bacteroidota bacterium]|nr:DsbA family oxidoreductase [Bacteroidota bacterium]